MTVSPWSASSIVSVFAVAGDRVDAVTFTITVPSTGSVSPSETRSVRVWAVPFLSVRCRFDRQRTALDAGADAVTAATLKRIGVLALVVLVGIGGQRREIERRSILTRRDVDLAARERRLLIVRRKHRDRDREGGLAALGVIGPRAVGDLERDAVLAVVAGRGGVDERAAVLHQIGTIRVRRAHRRMLGDRHRAAAGDRDVLVERQFLGLTADHLDRRGRGERGPEILDRRDEDESRGRQVVAIGEGVADELHLLADGDTNRAVLKQSAAFLDFDSEAFGGAVRIFVVAENVDVGGELAVGQIRGQYAVITSDRCQQRHILIDRDLQHRLCRRAARIADRVLQ